MFTWQNGTGDQVDKEGGHRNKSFRQKVRKQSKQEKMNNTNQNPHDKNGGCSDDSCAANGPKNNIDEHDIVNTERIQPVTDKEAETTSVVENFDEICGVLLNHDWRQTSRQVPSVTDNGKKTKSQQVVHRDPLSFAVVTKIDKDDKNSLVSFKSKWLANDKTSAANLWKQFSDSGVLDICEEESEVSQKGEIYASAVAIKKVVRKISTKFRP